MRHVFCLTVQFGLIGQGRRSVLKLLRRTAGFFSLCLKSFDFLCLSLHAVKHQTCRDDSDGRENDDKDRQHADELLHRYGKRLFSAHSAASISKYFSGFGRLPAARPLLTHFCRVRSISPKDCMFLFPRYCRAS